MGIEGGGEEGEERRGRRTGARVRRPPKLAPN